MKTLLMFDGTVQQSEIGYDHLTGWSIPSDVVTVEFEDGTVLANPNFDLEILKSSKVSDLESRLVSVYQEKQAADSLGLENKSLACTATIEDLQNQIEQIKMIGVS